MTLDSDSDDGRPPGARVPAPAPPAPPGATPRVTYDWRAGDSPAAGYPGDIPYMGGLDPAALPAPDLAVPPEGLDGFLPMDVDGIGGPGLPLALPPGAPPPHAHAPGQRLGGGPGVAGSGPPAEQPAAGGAPPAPAPRAPLPAARAGQAAVPELSAAPVPPPPAPGAPLRPEAPPRPAGPSGEGGAGGAGGGATHPRTEEELRAALTRRDGPGRVVCSGRSFVLRGGMIEVAREVTLVGGTLTMAERPGAVMLRVKGGTQGGVAYNGRLSMEGVSLGAGSVEVLGGAHLAMSDCHVSDTTQTGLVVNGQGSTAALHRCVVARVAGGLGVGCWLGGSLDLSECHVVRCGGSGLFVHGLGSRAVVRGGTVSGCTGHAVEVTSGGHVELVGTRLLKAGRSGLYVSGHASRARASGVQVTEAAGSGVVCDAGGAAHVLDCGVARCGDFGLMARGDARGDSVIHELGCVVEHCRHDRRTLAGGSIVPLLRPPGGQGAAG